MHMELIYKMKKPASIKDFLKENEIPLKLIVIEKNKFLIKVGTELKTKEDTVKKGDTLTIAIQNEEPDPKIVPQAAPLDIIFEDPYLLIVNKPAGQPMMISKSASGITLANAIAYYYTTIHHVGKIHYVNRLDKEASGLVVIAKHRFIKFLIAENAANPFKHEHQAILEGVLDKKDGCIDLPIGKREEDSLVREIMENGEECQTEFRVIQELPRHTLIKITAETGRTHQIRVHFAYFDYPIVGDHLYNKHARANDPFLLFSSKVMFKHPISNQTVDEELALPDEFRAWMKQSGGK
jgi:23S rRNA pseudouridine1911/1915/1917 synthase